MNKIVLKIGGTIMVLFLIVLLPLGYVANQIFTNFYYSQAREEIKGLSQRYALTITSLDDEKILNMFKRLADLTNKEIYIIDNEGDAVADSGVGSVNISNEELNALLSGQAIHKRFEANDQINYLGSGYPIIQSNNFEGAFFVLSPISDIQEPVEKIRDLLILSAIGTLFLALAFTFILSRKMSEPLLEMEQAAREIAKGNLDIRVAIPSNDEIGTLAKAINDLALETNRYRTNRREFFANISHELRTPVSYLQGYSQVLKEELYQTEEERIQYLTIIEQESERMVRLINDLFDLSKMEEGKFDLEVKTVDIAEVLESAILKTSIEAEKKGLMLKRQVSDILPYIEADPIRLEQIFINLLGNAIRYTEHGSIHVWVWETDKKVQVSIKDTGIGIPEKELPFIFERFHRVEKSRSRELGGTGLGLAIVKNLMELQHGTISVSSEAGKGTTFHLGFPAAE